MTDATQRLRVVRCWQSPYGGQTFILPTREYRWAGVGAQYLVARRNGSAPSDGSFASLYRSAFTRFRHTSALLSPEAHHRGHRLAALLTTREIVLRIANTPTPK